jgi:hypothetical protein
MPGKRGSGYGANAASDTKAPVVFDPNSQPKKRRKPAMTMAIAGMRCL